MTLKDEVAELMAIKNMVQTEVFQKYFAKPMKEERDKLRTDFFSDDLKESWRKGGKQEGIQIWMSLVEQANVDLKNKLEELETLENPREH